MKKSFLISILILFISFTNTLFAQEFFCAKDISFKSQEDHPLHRHDYDVKFYDITVNWYNVLKNSNRVYNGKVKLVATVDTPQTLNIIYLNCGLTVDSVIQNNTKLNYSLSSNVLSINLDRNYTKNETFEVDIYFRRTRTDNLGFYYYPKGSQTLENLAYTMSQPSDARYWFPCYDFPNDKADSARLTIIVPKDNIATGNGLLVSKTIIGDSAIFVWHEPKPIASYLIAITASKYSQFNQYYISKYPPYETIEIQHYQWASDSARSVYVARNLNLMMECFETYYGKYPFVKYGHSFVSPFLYGGMEHQTISTLHRNWLTSDAQSGIAHELAHMWWGDMVTCATWKDIWLNEGFATFSEDLYREFIQGKDAYFSSMNAKANYYYSYNPGYAIYNPPYIFSAAITYYKAALVLNMLRYVLGDSLFFLTLKNYREQFIYSNVITEDLKNVVNQTTNEDHSYFFNQWIYQPDHPIYAYNWNSVQNGNFWTLNFYIKQNQTHYSVYKMPIELKVSFANGDTIVKFMNTERIQSISFTFSSQPTNVVVDPKNYILKQITRDLSLEVSNSNVINSFHLFQNYPNPFNSQTTIRFQVPYRTRVIIKLYDITGNEVKTIENDLFEMGEHSIQFDAKDLPSGVYFYKIFADKFTSTRKLVLIK